MRLPFIAVLSIFFAATLTAQDQIILLNGDRIDAKVLEIGNDIRYKRTEMLDGPDYVLEKVRVQKIVYADGSTETFNGVTADDSDFYAGTSWLRMDGRKFYQGDRLLTREELTDILSTQPDILQKFERGRGSMTFGRVVTTIGLITAVSGYSKTVRNNDSGNGSQPGMGRMLSGLGIGLVGVLIGSGGGRKMKDSIKDYNSQLGRSGHVAPALSPDGVGIVVRF